MFAYVKTFLYLCSRKRKRKQPIKTRTATAEQRAKKDMTTRTKKATSTNKNQGKTGKEKKQTTALHPCREYRLYILERYGQQAAIQVMTAQNSLQNFCQRANLYAEAHGMEKRLTWRNITLTTIMIWENDELNNEKTMPGTIRRRTRNIRDMYNYWEKKGYIDENPTDAMFDALTDERTEPLPKRTRRLTAF